MTRDKKEQNLTLKHMAEVERAHGAEGSHPATKALLRQPRERGAGRTEQYTRVDRGHTE